MLMHPAQQLIRVGDPLRATRKLQMLDSLKGLAGTGKAQKQVDDLQSLITAAKEERSALSAMLTQISMRSAKLSQMGKSLEQVDSKASAATSKVDELVKRLD